MRSHLSSLAVSGGWSPKEVTPSVSPPHTADYELTFLTRPLEKESEMESKSKRDNNGDSEIAVQNRTACTGGTKGILGKGKERGKGQVSGVEVDGEKELGKDCTYDRNTDIRGAIDDISLLRNRVVLAKT